MPFSASHTLLCAIGCFLSALRGQAQQQQDRSPIASTCANDSADAWIAHVRPLALQQQVAVLRQRVACEAKLRPPQTVLFIRDRRPEGPLFMYLVDGHAGLSPTAFERLVTQKSVKKITFLPSQEAVTIGGMRASGGMAIITTTNPRDTRRQVALEKHSVE
jgi:hypothetical protein